MNARAEPAPAPRRARRRRGEAAEDFRLMADHAPVMIWVSGPDRKCVFVNRPWREFTGRTLDDSVGHGWSEGLHPDDRERTLAAFARAFDRCEPLELQYRLKRRDGAWRWLHDKAVPLVIDERLEGFIGSCLDITDRLEAEQEARRLLERERGARAEAESAAHSRDQFLAIVSHELRSPLNGIKSWTHVLQNQLRNAEPTVRRALAGIMIGVDHQVRLIEDLLDVTRALSGNLRLLRQPMALAPVLAEALESQRATAAEKVLQLHVEMAIGERRVDGDPDRIRQVFVNLLTNAIKFTPRGGSIWVVARAEGGEAVIEVRDNGAGISAGFLPHVFDPFRQADEGPQRRNQEGLGLGLALVRSIAAMHGGRAECASAGPARGSTFRVYLPLIAEARGESATEQPRVAPHAPALPSLAGVRILLIDDQREARESLATLLQQSGAQVVAAASGEEALAHLALADPGEQPQVIVCDIAMPDEDGYATLRRIRAWEAARGIARRPAIALSAFAQREDRVKALAEGFQMHLAKPVAPAQLMEGIWGMAGGRTSSNEETAMSKRKDTQPDVNEGKSAAKDRPERGGPEPDTLEGPGGRQETKAEQEARNKTTRRGER